MLQSTPDHKNEMSDLYSTFHNMKFLTIYSAATHVAANNNSLPHLPGKPRNRYDVMQLHIRIWKGLLIHCSWYDESYSKIS